jgi:uncharacterized Fe-S center protein
VIEAPVQQQTAYDALHHSSLGSEQLEQLPCQQLQGNFFDEFQLGETLGQASQRMVCNMHFVSHMFAAFSARQAYSRLCSSNAHLQGTHLLQLLFL